MRKHVCFLLCVCVCVCVCVCCKHLLQAIHDRYSSLDAISGPDFEVQFKEDTISLAVSEDGVILPNGWSITPLVPPMVSLWHQLTYSPISESVTLLESDWKAANRWIQARATSSLLPAAGDIWQGEKTCWTEPQSEITWNQQSPWLFHHHVFPRRYKHCRDIILSSNAYTPIVNV